MRTIAIGDIHGCAAALECLIAAIEPARDDRLIFLGDYVDRGPDSKGVIDQLLALRGRCETIFLLGNHEIMLRSMLVGPLTEIWLQLGGLETVTSYGGSLANVPRRHVEFLLGLLPYYETDSALFVHANYDARLPLAEQTEQMLYWEHLGDEMPGQHFSGKRAFVGHTPQMSGEVGRFGHLTCLDTFCFGGGWLTALDVDTGQLWQASAAGELRQKRGFLESLWGKLDAMRSRTGQKPKNEAENGSKASNFQ